MCLLLIFVFISSFVANDRLNDSETSIEKKYENYFYDEVLDDSESYIIHGYSDSYSIAQLDLMLQHGVEIEFIGKDKLIMKKDLSWQLLVPAALMDQTQFPKKEKWNYKSCSYQLISKWYGIDGAGRTPSYIIEASCIDDIYLRRYSYRPKYGIRSIATGTVDSKTGVFRAHSVLVLRSQNYGLLSAEH